MSRRSREAKKLKRQQERRAKKDANAARYAEYKRIGKNSKSKRAKANESGVRQVKLFDHPTGRCYNVGCRKCFPNSEPEWRKGRGIYDFQGNFQGYIE
jgi:hypothetical protein